jgi:hypothetical protein
MAGFGATLFLKPPKRYLGNGAALYDAFGTLEEVKW